MEINRFYPILDTALVAQPVRVAEALLDAGVRILQLRHKGHFSRDVFAQAEIVARLCADAGALFVINDRADMAALLNAGLHVGQDDLSPADARKVVSASTVIGFSTHNEAQLRAAQREPVNYVALGPMFATRSKANPDPVVGLAELRRVRAFTSLPLVAIGGITRANAREVLDAGADSVAVIGDLLPPDPSYASLRNRAQEWLRVTRP